METVELTAERKAQLDNYAQRAGIEPAAALDEAIATFLSWQDEDFEETCRGIERGIADVAAGRTRPAEEFFAEIERKYGFSR